MRVLVTGTGGYIGSILAPSLAAAGHEVVGLDTSYYRGCDFGTPPAGFEVLDRDLRDVRADDLDGFAAVTHFGALSNDPIGDFDPALTHQINSEATLSLARAAREAGVRRFVFA